MDTDPKHITETGELTQEQRLIRVLYALEAQLERQASLRYTFARGVMYGFGTVVGATVLIAVTSGILASTYSSLAELPLVGQWFSEGTSGYLDSEER